MHRAFAGVPMEVLDPFIHMDQMGEVEYAAGEPKGTPWHPHRGFETFTYLIDGQFIHQDSHGGGGTIDDGGTQYMTAGDGILHIETPPAALVESGGLFHGLQLWINLPRAKKRIAPQYQDLQGHDLDHARPPTTAAHSCASWPDRSTGTRARASPTRRSPSPTSRWLRARRSCCPWPAEFNALAYALSGTGTVGTERRPFRGGQLAVLGAGESVVLQADAVAGVALAEPRGLPHRRSAAARAGRGLRAVRHVQPGGAHRGVRGLPGRSPRHRARRTRSSPIASRARPSHVARECRSRRGQRPGGADVPASAAAAIRRAAARFPRARSG